MKKRVFTLLLALLFAFAAFAFAACAEENAGTGGETDTEEGGGTEEPGTDGPSEEEPDPENPGGETDTEEGGGTEEPGTDDPSEEEPDPENPGGETGGEEGGGTEEPGTDNPSTEEPDPDDPSEEEPAATLSFAAAEAEVTRGETYEVTVTLGGALPAGRVFWYAQDDTVVLFFALRRSRRGDGGSERRILRLPVRGRRPLRRYSPILRRARQKSVTAVCTVRVTELMDYGTAALFAFEDDGETAFSRPCGGCGGDHCGIQPKHGAERQPPSAARRSRSPRRTESPVSPPTFPRAFPPLRRA